MGFRVRTTIYLMHGQPVTLAFVPGIDGHPEAVGDQPPAPPPRPPKLANEKPRRMTSKLIRKALGKDREHMARLRSKIGFAATMRRSTSN